MPQPQKPEQNARDQIDAMLTAAGWQLQNIDQVNLSPRGVAVREYPTTVGFVDYMLFVDRKPVGVIEAKPEGTSPSGVETQSDAYLRSTAKHIPIDKQSLTFGYISTGTETHFYDVRDPDCRPRPVFAFHRPETLADWLSLTTTLRGRLRTLPPLIKDKLRDCQIRAIEGLEKSFANNRPRALIQMATGSGKSFCAVNFVYRLIKYAGAKRVLFLVDRNTLGRQARTEFQQFQTPDDHRKFTELYNIQLLSSSTLDPVCKVTISMHKD
ncbi:MAG: DEAD/DEAH box helicase family protein [bacterium]|nr:DEAD/DEAH box helicase family protein [bacterium]